MKQIEPLPQRDLQSDLSARRENPIFLVERLHENEKAPHHRRRGCPSPARSQASCFTTLLPGPDVAHGRLYAQLSGLAGLAQGTQPRNRTRLTRPPRPRTSLRRAPSPVPAFDDWPSYNKTLTSERYSPLSQINTKNVGKLKVLCTYDVGQFAAFESGLIMVDNALIGTTEFDIFSLNPATCAENWRTHEDYPPSPSAGQPGRRLHGRHAVSRHPGRPGAGL